MIKDTTNRGFTLIELLVVIAIIGILASVVLASLNSARSKGADAAVKSNINNARVQAELFYDSQATPSYTGVCNSGTNTVYPMVTAADTANGTGAVVCSSNGTDWAIKAQLVSDSADWYCVDGDGQAKTYLTTTWSATAVTTCPAGS